MSVSTSKKTYGADLTVSHNAPRSQDKNKNVFSNHLNRLCSAISRWLRQR